MTSEARLDDNTLPRPDLLGAGGAKLRKIERFQIQVIQRTFEKGPVDSAIRWCQRHIGANWIHYATNNVCRVHGFERLPVLDPKQSFICVANHRTFFDMYVVMAQLMRRGLQHRIVFPIRSNFFYDTVSGFLLNGLMSFFAMYPPIFREKKLAALNIMSLDELAWLLRRGGMFLGMFPEGTRKQDDDPYTFLPAKRGVGRLIHGARATVLPVFVNGLTNDFGSQLGANFSRAGKPVYIVFGAPVDLSDLLEARSTLKVHQAIADRAMAAVAELGQEERRLRAES